MTLYLAVFEVLFIIIKNKG